MNPYANSLNPAREEGETFEQYKERRARLTKLAEYQRTHGKLLFNAQKGKPPAIRAENALVFAEKALANATKETLK